MSPKYQKKLNPIPILLIILSSIFFVSCDEQLVKPVQPRIEDGVLNLTEWDFQENGIYYIRRNSEFYWGRLISPIDFQTNDYSSEKEYVDLFADWSNSQFDRKGLGGYGYATYRFFVYLKENRSDMGIRVPCMQGTYRL